MDIQSFLSPWLRYEDDYRKHQQRCIQELMQPLITPEDADLWSVIGILQRLDCPVYRARASRVHIEVTRRVYRTLAKSSDDPPTAAEVWQALIRLADVPGSGVADYVEDAGADSDDPQPRLYFFTADGSKFDQGVCFKTLQNQVSKLNRIFFKERR